jgi:hypothetical protein
MFLDGIVRHSLSDKFRPQRGIRFITHRDGGIGLSGKHSIHNPAHLVIYLKGNLFAIGVSISYPFR